MQERQTLCLCVSATCFIIRGRNHAQSLSFSAKPGDVFRIFPNITLPTAPIGRLPLAPYRCPFAVLVEFAEVNHRFHSSG